MTSAYTTLIRDEEAKIDLLKAKISACERRIEILRLLQSSDDLDAEVIQNFVNGRIHSPTAASSDRLATASFRVTDAGVHEPRRRLTDDVVALLRYIGPDGKSLDDLERFCQLFGYKYDRAGVRSMMSTYRARHGFIESPYFGFFKLTPGAVDYLNRRHPEAQSEPPPASTGDGSDGSTQAAVQGGIESGDLA